MIYLLFGEDKYQILKRLEKIQEDFLKNSGDTLNITVLEGKELNFEDFQAQTTAVGLFEGKRFFVIKNLISKGKKEIQEKIANFLKENFPSYLVFIEEEKISPQTPLFQKIKKIGKIEEFAPLSDEKLKDWILQKIREKNLKIEKKALELLVMLVGNNLFQMENEIEKLSLYCQEKKKNLIEESDVNLLVSSNFRTNIFELIDAISEKNAQKALSLLLKFLEQGEDPLSILGMIIFQFRNLLMVKSLLKRDLSADQITQKTKLHPFVVKKTMKTSFNFQEEELKNIYKKLLEIDLDIKSGKISPQLALQLLIASLCQKQN